MAITDPRLNVLISQLKELRDCSPYLNLTSTLCLLQAAQRDNLSFLELEGLMGEISQASVSRNVAVLFDGGSKRPGAGLGLLGVEVCNKERRRKAIQLTPQGEDLVNRLLSYSA